MRGHHLRPVEKRLMQYAGAHPYECFCWVEFASEYNNTIRNAFSHLTKMKLLNRCCRSSNAYYILHTTNQSHGREEMTITHMEGRYGQKQMQVSYLSYIESFGWEEIWRVHDVSLCLEAKGLYEKMLAKKVPVIEQSGDIRFLDIEVYGKLYLSVFLHRTGSVTCYLKCSRHPMEVTPEGLVDLVAVLGKVALFLEEAAESSSFLYKHSVVPDVSSWVVTQWHFGKDGKKEISGKSFNTTFRNWAGALVRVYLKKCGDKFRARKEIIEQPKKPLPEAFSEKMASDEDYLPDDKRGSL